MQLKLCVALFLLQVSCGYGFHLQLFDETNFDGLFLETSSVAPCTDLPPVGQKLTSSLKTDACLIIYKDVGCRSYSIKVPAGEHTDLSSFSHATFNFDNEISSFHLCNESIGGNAINVGFQGFHDGAKQTLIQYTDVCGCINTPRFTHPLVDSLDNHGNCVKLYSQRDCTGDTVEISGGVSAESLDLGVVQFEGKMQSLGMCQTSSPCIRLRATVIKFVMNANATKVALQAIPSDVDLAATTTFRNNGSATVSQEYQAKRVLKEFYEVTRVKTMTEMHKVDVALGVHYEGNYGVPIVAYNTITAALDFAYTFEKNNTESESEKYTREDEREFVANQKIEIPACSEYSVNSYVKTYQSFPIDYEIYTKIRGEMGSRVMRTEELRERVTSMEYVEDFDDHTIIAKAYGSMTADFGVEAVVDGEGHIIDGCRQS